MWPRVPAPDRVIEKHGDHLPLGQDTIYIHRVCTLAAEKEAAMVFPFYYFGQILEAKHVPGTIAIHGDLLLPLLENVCDEIARNGFHKVVIVNGHGGNNSMLPFFCQLQLDKHKPYVVYLSGLPGRDEAVEKVREAKVDGHGGEGETCSMLHLRADLVKVDRFGSYGKPLGRADAFKRKGISAGHWWYSDFPGHFAAEKVPLTAEKGRVFVEAHVRNIVEQIQLIKSDDSPITLYEEFHDRATKPANRYP